MHVRIQVVRTFITMREAPATHRDLARKLDAMERKYDAQLKVVFDAIRRLMAPPDRRRISIGFRPR